GAITPERKIAWDAIEKMLGHANQLQVTFHRAIDLVDKNEETLKQLFDLGISRILTSGSVSNSENEWQSAANAKGLDLLLRIKNRPNILACGGIRPQNLKSLIALSDLTEIHSAARKTNFVEQEIVKELKAKWK
ncbi:MAG: copper homeostasis protein, partial [Limisphaerales bacterium]